MRRMARRSAKEDAFAGPERFEMASYVGLSSRAETACCRLRVSDPLDVSPKFYPPHPWRPGLLSAGAHDSSKSKLFSSL